MNAITAPASNGAVMEQVLLAGDLSKLNPGERVFYYKQVCDSVGLNPLTKPFAYLNLNGKLTLYALRDATDQLRKIHGVSVTIKARENIEGVYVVTANARDKTGREDESTGAVAVHGLKGDALANALMKAETKAKRRVTLSICGLGMLDETETETIPGAKVLPAEVDENATISHLQVAVIEKLVTEVGADRAGFLAYCKVEKFEDLKLRNFDAAIAALKRKKSNSCLAPQGAIAEVPMDVLERHVGAIVDLINMDRDEYETAEALQEYFNKHIQGDADMMCAVNLRLRDFDISSYQFNKWLELRRPQ